MIIHEGIMFTGKVHHAIIGRRDVLVWNTETVGHFVPKGSKMRTEGDI
jgi:hypothetical protein